jgi:hypothetical protein
MVDDPFDVNDGPVGWVCPRCRHVWAPMEPECVRCAVRLDPPPRPPEDGPHLGEDFESGRCPECRMPLTMHHEPGCSRRCGRCEECKARDAGEARLTVRLPGYMGDGAVHVALVTTVWAEVFPGVESSLRSVRTGAAEVEYRLAQAPGERQAGG